MIRSLGGCSGALFLALVLTTPALSQASLTDSPISPGFWSFPGKKTVAAADVVGVCRNHFEIRFADGHYIGLRAHKRDIGLLQREVESVGHCAFNRDTQTDRCDVKLIHADGSILAGTVQTKYAFDSQKSLKMTVTPKMITDSPVDNAPFDAYPVRCPDDVVWNILNESNMPK